MKLLKNMLLPLAVFVTGASVLIVEVVGVHILAPFYGNTIFTVSSAISVVLLALSCGYYLGGRLADRRPTLKYFFALILVSGLVLLFLYSVGGLILPILSSQLSIVSGPLVSATLLFLLPALLLGTLCPFAIKVQSVHTPEQGVGAIAGNIFFWSTLGSIAGSLSAGFLLIPRFGIDRILITNGVVLCLVGFVPLLAFGSKNATLYASALIFLLLLAGAVLAARRTRRQVLYTADGVYQKITIYDGQYAGRPARFLQEDENSVGAGEGAMFLDTTDPGDLVYEYTRYYSLYKIFHPELQNALVIGAGAYSVPKALLHELPDVSVDVVDIEPSLFALAQRYFEVPKNSRLHNYVQDGRRFLRDSNRQYDLIFADVYYSLFSVPPHFTTKEFFSMARKKLSANGILIVNVVGDLSRQQPSLIFSEIKTFRMVFPNSYFFAVAWPEKTATQNVVLVGYNGDTRVDLNSPSVLQDGDPFIRFLASKLLDVDGRFDLLRYPILTDNFAPVEFLTAKILRRAFAEEKLVDGDEMAADVAQQQGYGSRSAGTDGHKREQDFLLAEMRLLSQEVRTETWQAAAPDGKAYQLTNIIGRLYSSPRRILLATHYASSAPSSPEANEPRLLNDSSGVAILIELARSLADSNVPAVAGIDLLFLDGPGGNVDASHEPRGPLTYFVQHLQNVYPDQNPVLAVLVDNVCRAGLQLLKEKSSIKSASDQVQAIWNIGHELSSRIFVDQLGPQIEDDQAALMQTGIPTVVISDPEDRVYAQARPRGVCNSRNLQTLGAAIMQYVTTPQKFSHN